LRAADPEDGVHAGHVAGGEDDRGVARRADRRHDDDLPYPGDARRDDRHEYGRGIGGAPAGHVDADPVERLDALAEARPARVAEGPRALALAEVEAPDATGGEREIPADGGGKAAGRRRECGARNAEPGAGEAP